MTRHLQNELRKLRNRVLSLGALVEENLHLAVKSIEGRDVDLAARVVGADREIDEMEVEVEEECLKIMALHQPVAVDLRFLAAVIKINNDLERIGDEAVNIAERVIYLASRSPVPIDIEYVTMAEKTQRMLKDSLDSLVNLDADLAYKVILKDDEVDTLNREIIDKVIETGHHHPEHVGPLISHVSISRYLERIADHATNIAEEVIYMIEGEIPRHRSFEW
ncbi:MAG TPA: phosphate signaling complex protein PhoU [Desulfobacteraceae bacterium]|nr:phosphate signaling complex protein PhoU [Desulfobacteraceae bacterium]